MHHVHVDGLMQERRNSIANASELLIDVMSKYSVCLDHIPVPKA